MRTIAPLLAVVFGLTMAAQQPAASSAVSTRGEPGAYGYFIKGEIACGGGAAVSGGRTLAAGMCGAGMGIFPFVMTEVGVSSPILDHDGASAYFSTDAEVPIAPSSTRDWHGHPVVIGGFTEFFGTAHALDFGAGYEYHLDKSHSLQFELRDYYAFTNPQQHNVAFRVALLTGIND